MASIKEQLPQGLKRSILKLVVYPYIWFSKRKIHIRANSSDINVVFHNLVIKEYNTDLPFGSPKVIIDGGANIGLASIYFSEVYPEAKIFALEPESSNYDLLTKNTVGIDQVLKLKNGLWSSNKKLKIDNPNDDKWSFQTIEMPDNTTDFDVEGVSISSLMGTYNLNQIDILKVDIEGAEKEIFSKNESEWLPKTNWIITELHGEECEKVFLDAMEKYNFKHMLSKGENLYYKNQNIKG